MALTDAQKAQLDRLRQELARTTGIAEIQSLLQNIRLYNISKEDLKSLVEPNYVGIDYESLNYATLDTDTMNALYPGSINVRKLSIKLANDSLVKARSSDIVDTQSGVLHVLTELRSNVDIEDEITAMTASLGTNLQLINSANYIRAERVADKEIKSVFVEDV